MRLVVSNVRYVLLYFVHVGKVSLTLRHRLVCEIRSKNKAVGKADPPKARHPSDPDRDGLLSPDNVKPRKPSKFSSKLVITTEDLKMKMLVRFPFCSHMSLETIGSLSRCAGVNLTEELSTVAAECCIYKQS